MSEANETEWAPRNMLPKPALFVLFGGKRGHPLPPPSTETPHVVLRARTSSRCQRFAHSDARDSLFCIVMAGPDPAIHRASVRE